MIQDKIVNDVKLFQEWLMCQSDSKATAKNYGSAIHCFLNHFSNKYSRPADIPVPEIVNYLLSNFYNLHSRRNAHSAIKKYYIFKSKNGISNKFKYIPYPVKPQTIPDHVTTDDFIKIISATTNIKHKSILLLAYDCGLRVSEVINMKLTDIDGKNMNVIVRQSKGKKDRLLKLTVYTLALLREYYKQHKPKFWLFENDYSGAQYSVRSCQELFTTACKRAGVKHYKFHALRHGFSMALYEKGGYSLETLRDLLGHVSVETTKIYARKSNVVIQKTQSPVELIIVESINSPLKLIA